MKVIDLYLAIERNENIPKEVVYKYKKYRYYPEYKQYYREEYSDRVSLFLEASMEDKVYLIEDTPTEEKKIPEKLEQFNDVSFYAINEYTWGEFVKKINSIIDYLKSKEE